MKRVAFLVFLSCLAGRPAHAAVATFTPLGPTSVPAGTDVNMALTVSAQTLPNIDAADIMIGSFDATNLYFAYSSQWINAFANPKPLTYDLFGIYPQEVLVGGNNPLPVNTPLLVGTLTIKTDGMAPGDYAATIDAAYDEGLSALYRLGVGDPLFGLATFTIIACPGLVEPCCRANGTCFLSDPSCCLAQGGTPQGPVAVCQGDADGDGIDELCGDPCIGFPNVDSDGDGHCDATDLCFGFPNVDQDDDEVCDGEDNCPAVSNPSQSDLDGDGVGNHCDNCLSASNSDQNDCNADGVGDACDTPSDRDDDADGVCNGADNCPTAANADQSDVDGDGRGDVCDPCPSANPDDADGDGVCDSDDFCMGFPNVDIDQDGLCDAQDPCTGYPNQDDDEDGLCDASDPCEGFPNIDADGDGVCDAQDPCAGTPNIDGDADGICDALDLCPNEDDRLDDDNDGIPDCLQRGIPTVSEWGLVILILSLLVASKLRFAFGLRSCGAPPSSWT